MIKHFGILVFCVIGNTSTGQVAGDFRSKVSGNWSSPLTWEIYNGTTWVDANTGQFPGEENSVWVQNTHAITLTGNHAVKNIHLNAGLTSTDGSGNGRINIGNHILELYGHLAGYRAPIGTVPGIPWNSTIGYSPLGINSNPSGALKIVGKSRSITAPDSYADAFYRFRCIIDPGDGEEITVSFQRFRASEIDVVSGTLNMGTSSLRCQSDAADDPVERLTIRKGARLISAASGTGNNAVIARGESTTMAAVLIEEGGILEIRGSNPRMRVRAIENNGTIIYSGEGNQSLLRSNGGIDPAEFNNYNSLILSGSGVKTIPGLAINVRDSLIFEGTATLNLESDGSLEYTGPESWLVYRGSNTQVPSSSSWQSNSSNMQVLLDNPAGLSINQALDIPNIFRLQRGIVNFSETGALTLLADANFEGGGTSSYVNGPINVVGNSHRHLPIGKLGIYRPLSGFILGTGHTYRVELLDSPVSGIPQEPLVKLNNSFHWRLIPVMGTLQSGVLTFLYDTEDIGSADSDIRIAFSPTLYGDFEKLPVVNNEQEGQITIMVNPSGIYTLGTIAPTSALRFTDFTARALMTQNQVRLEWSIISEEHSEKMVIHRSRDGRNWQAVAYLPIYSLNKKLEMSYLDRPLGTGFWFYKLEHRLKSGHSYWSKVLRVDRRLTLAESISVWYNKQDESLNITLKGKNKEEELHEVEVFGLSGDRIYQAQIAAKEGSIQTQPIGHLPQGIYVVSLRHSGYRYMRRIIVP